jgi:large-conductance mechanosensitive channel/energy-converting hydrogenase Eha subunit F
MLKFFISITSSLKKIEGYVAKNNSRKFYLLEFWLAHLFMRQSEIECNPTASWISSECDTHALCVPENHGERGFCICNADFANYKENSVGTCDRSALTWMLFAYMIFLALMCCQIAYRICVHTWKVKRMGTLKFDTLGLTSAMLVGTSFGLMSVLFTRAAAIIINEREGNSKARTTAAAAQAIFTLCFVIALSFVGASMLFVVHQSARLEAGAERYRRNLFVGATINGSIVAIIVLYLSVINNVLAFTILIILHSATSWLIYHVLRQRLQRHFPASFASNQPVLQIITTVTNHVIIGILCVIFGSTFFALSFGLGREERSLLLMGPVCAGSLMVNYLSIVIVVHVMVRCVEKLAKNRQAQSEVRGSINSVDAVVEFPTIKPNERKSSDQTSFSVTPLISNPSGIVDKQLGARKTHNNNSYANVLYPSFQSSRSIEDMESIPTTKPLTTEESDSVHTMDRSIKELAD